MKKNVKIKMICLVVVSVVFIYLSFKDIQVDLFLGSIGEIRWEYCLFAAVIFLLISYLRSYRWGLLISPIMEISQRELYPMACFGIMCGVVFPMKTGEFVRPYLLAKNKEIPMGTTLAISVAERTLDVLTILLFSVFILFTADMPGWMYDTIHYVFILSGGGIAFIALCWLLSRKRKIFKAATVRFRNKIGDIMLAAYNDFLLGLGFGSQKKAHLLYAALFSILIWILNVFAIYLLFLANAFALPSVAAVIVLVVSVVGISIPAAPGYIGTFHYACMLSLSLFDISKNEAITFSTLYYFLAVGGAVFLGLLFIGKVKVPLGDFSTFLRLTKSTPSEEQQQSK